jgi:hypothetical protein
VSSIVPSNVTVSPVTAVKSPSVPDLAEPSTVLAVHSTGDVPSASRVTLKAMISPSSSVSSVTVTSPAAAEAGVATTIAGTKSAAANALDSATRSGMGARSSSDSTEPPGAAWAG